MGNKQTETTEFIIYLLEHGGLYRVEPNPSAWGGAFPYQVVQDNTGQAVEIAINEQLKGPAVVYHMDRDPGKYWLINPFKESDDPQKDGGSMWFREVLINNILAHFSTIVRTMTTIPKKSDEYRMVKELLGDLGIDFSKDTYTQYASIPDLEKFITIVYDPKTRTGQVQSDFVDWYRETEGTGSDDDSEYAGIKVKNRKLLYNLILKLLIPNDVEDIYGTEIEEHYTYTASHGSGAAKTLANNPAPHNEVFIYLYHKVCQRLIPVLEALTSTEYHMDYFDQQILKIADFQHRTASDYLTRPTVETVTSSPKTANAPTDLPPARAGYGLLDRPEPKSTTGLPPIRGNDPSALSALAYRRDIQEGNLPPARGVSDVGDYTHLLPTRKAHAAPDYLRPPADLLRDHHPVHHIHRNDYTI
jgi:hypothetical protein